MLRNRKRTAVFVAIFILFAAIIVSMVTYFEYKAYTRNYNQKLNAICNRISKDYPDINSSELMEILNSDNESKENFFARYGIDLEKESVILKNDNSFRKFLAANIVMMTVFLGVIVFGIYMRNRYLDKEISQITTYLKNINSGNYSFDMDAVKEGDLSILESEVYKTTIMLKAAADNSLLDKQRLKDSLSDISHQLKTPITSLVINLENIEDNPDIDIESRNRLIANAKRDTNRINHMVKQLLTLSKFDANVVEYKKEKVLLSSIVGEAIENVSALSELMGIEIVCKNKEGEDAELICDSYWQKQAITNILKNGIEHAKTQISISYENCGLYRQIIIENDGQPISEEDRKNIFKRFYSGQNSSNENVGIGLAIANAAVRKDGGYIVVDSDDSVRFIVRYV